MGSFLDSTSRYIPAQHTHLPVISAVTCYIVPWHVSLNDGASAINWAPARSTRHVEICAAQRHGSGFSFTSGFRSTYASDNDMGHLSLSMMKSELLPSQKAIIAMSRAQYLAYLRPSKEDGSQATSSTPNSKKDGEETKRNPARPIVTPKPTDKLSVGVCIFRLDGQTLSPAVLLLRRSPRWWRRRILASVGGKTWGRRVGIAGRQG